MTDYMSESPLILSFSPWEKGRQNNARSVPHRPLSHGEKDRVRGGTLEFYAMRPQTPLALAIEPGEPSHGVSGCRYRWAGRDEGPLDHHDRQAERAGGFDFGDRCVAAGILGQDNLDAVLAKQAEVVLRREGAARLDEDDVWQIERAFGQVDQADDVDVLRRGLKLGEGETADAAEDFSLRRANRLDGGGHIGREGPIVAGLRLPGGPFDGEQRRAGCRSRFDGVAAHLRGERMRGIHERIDTFVLQIADEAFDTAEAAVSGSDRLGAWRRGPAGEGECGCKTAVRREQPCKRARFRRASEEKNAHGQR